MFTMCDFLQEKKENHVLFFVFRENKKLVAKQFKVVKKHNWQFCENTKLSMKCPECPITFKSKDILN
jgi:hypothetical protein